MLVVGIVAFLFFLGERIQLEKTRLEKAKQAAIKIDNVPVSVITLSLTPMRLEDKINLPGYVDPYEDLRVKAEVGGQVVNIPVKEGQTVKKGQILVELDDRDYRLRISRIEAAYELAKLDTIALPPWTRRESRPQTAWTKPVPGLRMWLHNGMKPDWPWSGPALPHPSTDASTTLQQNRGT